MKLRFTGWRKRTWDSDDAEGEAVTRLELGDVRIKRILVAVDFSERSRRALEYATGLARKLEAEIVLLHVFEGVPGELKILEASFVDTSFREQAQVNLAQWQGDLRRAGLGVETAFRDGAAIDREILRVAVETRADLIVVGRRSGDGLLSSNTVAKILRNARFPVLVGP